MGATESQYPDIFFRVHDIGALAVAGLAIEGRKSKAGRITLQARRLYAERIRPGSCSC